MPIDYTKYPENWRSEIRPLILKRANNKCEVCGVENYTHVFRCYHYGKECYQDVHGNLYDAENSKILYMNSECLTLEPLTGDKAIKIVLTIAHLNHNITDNREENLKAMCQRCHLRYDKNHHIETRRKKKYKDQINIRF